MQPLYGVQIKGTNTIIPIGNVFMTEFDFLLNTLADSILVPKIFYTLGEYFFAGANQEFIIDGFFEFDVRKELLPIYRSGIYFFEPTDESLVSANGFISCDFTRLEVQISGNRDKKLAAVGTLSSPILKSIELPIEITDNGEYHHVRVKVE